MPIHGYLGGVISATAPSVTTAGASGVFTLEEQLQASAQNNWPGYQITRSVRLRSSASAYFNRTLSTPTDSTKFTFSAWVKRGSLSSSQGIFQAGNTNYIQFASSDTIQLVLSNTTQLTTTPVFRDPSAWGHLVVSYNNAVSPKWNFYYNNLNIGTSTASNTTFNTATAHGIANPPSGGGYFDGYLTEINFIDGQALTPTSFGAFDSVTGVWNPIRYSGTYGNNGFYLNFKDPTSTTTIGYDYSGNSNNWTANNISVTAGTTYDSMVDVPIGYGSDTGVGGELRGNYPVWNPLARFTGGNTAPITNGNLQTASGGNPTHSVANMLVPASGKFYFEVTCTSLDVVRTYIGFMTTQSNVFASGNLASYDCNYTVLYSANGGYLYANTTSVVSTTYGASYATGDVIGVAYDNGKIWFAKNGSWQASGDPAAGTNAAVTGWNVYGDLYPYGGYNSTLTINFGQRAFSYTAPTGFKALCTQNLPTATVSNGANYMAASLYTGTGASQTVSNAVNGISFQPDLVWIKSRSAATNNKLTDSVRGATKAVISNTSGAETTDTNGLTAFGSSGFTVGTDTVYNNSGATYVGWNWKGGGTAVTNNDGNRTASVSASTTAGFSVVTYTFSTSATNTIGHGLGAAPSMLLSRNRTVANNWDVYHISLGYTQRLILNDTGAASGGGWAATPTSTVFSVTTGLYLNNDNIVTYCFAPIAGYSAFGLYTGNGSTDGPFIYLGFRPRFVLVKDTVNATYWEIGDSSRNTYNAVDANLYPNSAFAEAADPMFDFLANGFKVRKAGGNFNNSGAATIYAAFAENPFNISRAR